MSSETKEDAIKRFYVFSQLASEIRGCKACDLGKTCNKHVVWAYSNDHPKVVFVGEAPGADEDKFGVPFVGRAGGILRGWVKDLELKSWAFVNIIKCRPPDNREPTSEEVEKCFPFLERQLELLKPELIVCLGKTACNSLGFDNKSILKNIGKIGEWKGIKTMSFVHPSYCLRTPGFEAPINIIKSEIGR